MRIVGRYFATGATLGSISGLVALVLIWSWMTIHLGLLGFLVGWIPAGLVAAAVWVTMVVFWAPVLVVGVLIAMVVLALGSHHHRERDWDTPPSASRPDETPPPADTAPSRDYSPPAEASPMNPPPMETPAPPPEAPTPSAAPSAAPAAPSAAPPPASSAPVRPPKSRQSDDLGSDAAAAGDTSHKRPQ